MPSDLIKPTSDLFMASLWSVPKNEPILRSLLNGVMTDAGESAVTKAIVLNPFNIQDSPLDKQIRLDVLVEDETKAVYNIEIQTDSHSGFFQRILYYWSETYGSQLQRGDDYFKLRPVRSIVITEFPIFPLLQKLHTIFEVRSRENSSVLLSDHFQIHFLRLGGWKEAAAKESDRRETAVTRGEETMSALLQDTPEVQAAYEEYRRFTADPAMRAKAKIRERFMIEQQLNRNEALEEGLAKGEAKKAKETARKMKARASIPN